MDPVKILKKLRSNRFKQLINNFAYTKYFKKEPIREKTVFYQAYRPKIMSGNPYAMFKYMMEHPEYGDYVHYWAYGDDEVLRTDTCKKFSNYPNVKFVRAGSREYMKCLSSCQYVINNAALPDYWQKKEGQVYINTWHGTPLKALGKLAKDRSNASIVNAQRNFLMCDYMVMPNAYTTDKMLESYDLKNMLNGCILDAGYPRVDLVLKTDGGHIKKLLEEKLGEELDDRKIILYAPTFRSEGGKSINSSLEACQYVEELMDAIPSDKYVIFFKIHNMMLSYFKNIEGLKSRLIFNEIETNELLSVVDILITDYSSIFFDFLCTKRPILFFTYDREKYEAERGLYVPLDEMPGALCYTVSDIVRQIRDIESGNYDHSEKHEKFLAQFGYWDDGRASERVCRTIFEGEPMAECVKYSRPDKEKILLFAGKMKTPKARSLCFYVLNHIDYKKYDVSIVGEDLFHYDEAFLRISPDIKLLCSPLRFNRTLWEYIRLKLFGVISKAAGHDFYGRQFRKIFGGLDFAVLINLTLKDNQWMKLFRYADIPHKVWAPILRPKLADSMKKYQNEYEEIYIVAGDDKPETFAGMDKVKFIDEEKTHEALKDRKMKVLFISAFDSTNYVFVNIIKELEKRGYRFVVVVRDGDDYMNNKMYINAGIPFVPIDEFDYEELSDVDFVFSAPLQYICYKKLLSRIRRENKFIITFANLFSSIVMRVYPDLAFAVGESKFQEFKDNGLRYNMLALGNPQYDGLIETRDSQKRSASVSRVLIIDQGGYPFGDAGKRTWGDTILNIARNNPDKQFVVKPRYLPDEEGRQLHKQTEHIYSYLTEKPDNLTLLYEPTILEELILDFDAAITTWSTAYLDAAVLRMPLLLVSGLPSEDIFDVRLQRVGDAYSHLEASGCVRDYRELLDKPLRFPRVDEGYLKRELYDIDHPCAPRIVSSLEKMYPALILREKRFDGFIEGDYKDFDSLLRDQSLISTDSNRYLRRKNYLNQVSDKLQELAYVNRCMGNKLDVSAVYGYWSCEITEETTRKQVEKKLKELDRAILRLQDSFFETHSADLGQDLILQDYYLDWLFKKRKYGTIMQCVPEQYLCPESVYFYRAMVLLKRKQYAKGAAAMIRYYQITREKEVHHIKKDRNIIGEYLPSAPEDHTFLKELEEQGGYEILLYVCGLKRYQVDIRTYYLIKAHIGLKEPEQAIEVYESYIKTQEIVRKAQNRRIRRVPASIQEKYAAKCADLYQSLVS